MGISDEVEMERGGWMGQRAAMENDGAKWLAT